MHKISQHIQKSTNFKNKISYSDHWNIWEFNRPSKECKGDSGGNCCCCADHWECDEGCGEACYTGKFCVRVLLCICMCLLLCMCLWSLLCMCLCVLLCIGLYSMMCIGLYTLLCWVVRAVMHALVGSLWGAVK